MCCFSKRVQSVSATNIFARATSRGRQYLAYEMTLSAAEDLAMILPLPVPEDTAEDAVKFIDLSGYSELFKDIMKGFPQPVALAGSRLTGRLVARRLEPLAVVEVGSFEASFVPTIGDFDRLDARFRLPTSVWSKLPGYKQFGFAVFKLKKGDKRVHPMAFSFPRASADKLFFPTVHIHDGKVYRVAHFDHALFCQRSRSAEGDLSSEWRRSKKASDFVDVERTHGIVDGKRAVHRLRIEGPAPNEDTYVED